MRTGYNPERLPFAAGAPGAKAPSPDGRTKLPYKGLGVKIILVPAFLLLLFAACGQQAGRSELEIAAPVTVQDVTQKPIEQFVTTTGTVSATQTDDLATETQGYYQLGVNPRTKRPFSIGDEAKKGETIVQLTSPELENSVKIDSQKLNLDLTQRELEKQKSLYDKGGVTLTELTNAERSLMDAKYGYENALLSLAKLKVKAPFDGILTDITYYTPGIQVSSGSAVGKIMNYRVLTMDVSLPAKQLGLINPNQQVRVTNVNLAGQTFAGKVTQVSPSLDPTTRTFKAVVLVENQGILLKPGMFVKAEIVVARHENAVVIPKEVITSRRQNKTVFVVENSTATERQITTGLENPTEVEVTEGLAVNDRLVIKGFETLRNRAKVKVAQ
jgi:membrane fusion protein, multidrug efflux system